jgi:AraC-like DNA-binding protein
MVNYQKYLDLEIFEGDISFHEYPWHFHDCFTLIVVEKGLIKYEFHEKQIQVEAGKGFIIEPGIVHRNSINESTIYKAIFVPCEYFNSIEKYKILTQKFYDSNTIDSIIDLHHKIKLNYSKSEINERFVELTELINYSQTEKKKDTSLKIDNINSKIDYNLTIEQLAKKAHLSKFHFQRKFKKNFGLTIGQLKQQEKTIEAKTLLENGKLSTDVAHELGFFDQSHFIKYFKKMWALTPKNFK